jgi:hypothetical protein
MIEWQKAIDTIAVPKGGYMKKIVLLVVIAAFTVSPASAASKHKKSKQNTEGRGDRQAERQYQTPPKGRAPAGAADLVASYLFQHA